MDGNSKRHAHIANPARRPITNNTHNRIHWMLGDGAISRVIPMFVPELIASLSNVTKLFWSVQCCKIQVATFGFGGGAQSDPSHPNSAKLLK